MFEDKIIVSQLMTKTITVGSLSTKFSQVAEFFTSFKVHHLPICENDVLIGMISYTDLLKFIIAQMDGGKSVAMEGLDNVFNVSEIMTKNLVAVGPKDPIEKARELLSSGVFQALPVVEDGKIIGILSNKDIVRLDAQL